VISTAPLANQVGILVPGVQAQDGSFVGSYLDDSNQTDMVAFDAGGNVRWTVPNEQPQYATHDGGVVGTSGIFYDERGNARNLLTPALQSWLTESYVSTGGAIADVQLPQIQWASSYQAITGGNPSFNETSVGVAQSVEGLPVYGLKSRGPTCQLGANEVLLSGAPFDWANNERQQLINGGYMTSTACREFFDQPDAVPARAPFFSLLTTVVTENLPVFWDGLQTNISMYAAGFLSANNTNPTDIGIYKLAPVCGEFVTWVGPNGTVKHGKGPTTASAQISSVGGGASVNVYINTNPNVYQAAALLQGRLTESTILHEALHNLTGLCDDDLAFLLGLHWETECTKGSVCISQELTKRGCAGPN
jgi:hypothetical protein